ncbi:MAG: hypothetical protein WA210_10390 [Burkholderiaceae bacterium]
MQRMAQLADALHQAVVADDHVRPHATHQLCLGDREAGPARQALQHSEHLRPKCDSFARRCAQFSALEVEHESLKLQPIRIVVSVHCRGSALHLRTTGRGARGKRRMHVDAICRESAAPSPV